MGVKQNYRALEASAQDIVTRSLPIPPRVSIEQDFDDFFRRLDLVDDWSEWDASDRKAQEALDRIEAIDKRERMVLTRKQPKEPSKALGLIGTAVVFVAIFGFALLA